MAFMVDFMLDTINK